MDIRFSPHNLHLESLDIFTQQDPNLRALTNQKLVHKSSLLDDLPLGEPGIYTITGGRQIGKTTLLKQWMQQIIKNNVSPESVLYLTGELIDDHHALVRIVMESLKQKLQYLLIDEITYIRNWDKGIKYLADTGTLENVTLVLTGSDLVVIKEARMRFPGRRGLSDNVDFHLFPLNFYEYVKLNNRITSNEICNLVDDEANESKDLISILYAEFERYLAHGGFLTAINDMALHNRILPATF